MSERASIFDEAAIEAARLAAYHSPSGAENVAKAALRAAEKSLQDRHLMRVNVAFERDGRFFVTYNAAYLKEGQDIADKFTVVIIKLSEPAHE